MAAKIAGRFVDWLWKLWYPIVTRMAKDSGVTFLNYGYVADGPPIALRPEDEANRACIGLYQRVAGAVDLRGLNVLEVSSGHGGGAAYVARTMQPQTMRGVDRNPRAVAFCQKTHNVEGLTFSCGNALALDFPEKTFDAVINVEASHCYPDIVQFFAEVGRVLKPGGHFLYTDFRDAGPSLETWEAHIKSSGLQLVGREDITAKVLRGMQLNTETYLKLIQQVVPWFLRRPAREFSGVPGSIIYRALESGKTKYVCYHLRKPI